jgi:SAM-dependent methyltransferase
MVPCGSVRRRPTPATPALYSRPVSDLPLGLPGDGAAALRLALDQERKIDRALEALGPLSGRDVVVLDGGDDELQRTSAAGARLTTIPVDVPLGAADDSADVIVSRWTGFRAVESDAVDDADRVLRPGGRLLVVHDYGRDDVSRLRGELEEHGDWTRRDGPLLTRGFRIRVIHCFWTFDTIEAARAFLEGSFGAVGRAVGDGLKRPRLSYNVAIYHRTRGGVDAREPSEESPG